VNLLFLVEGEKTEPKVYKAWLKHLFPSLNFVIRPEDMTKNTCRIIPGNGYPNMVSTPKLYPQVSRLEACLIDIERFGNVDHFFICVDSEDESYTDRFNEIQHKVNDFKSRRNINEAKIKIHIIIQYCCIETWALGNAEIPHQYPSSNSSRILPQFRAYYDVTVYDPEGMYGYPEGFSFSKKAKFHQSYLKEYLREFGLSYSKNNPQAIQDEKYLEALKKRCQSTHHLTSLKLLLDIWNQIKDDNTKVSLKDDE